MRVRDNKGVTLVELMVALAIASILMLGVVAAFQTTQRTAAVGEAREQIYQNARVALDIMSREIKAAYIDNRNRDLVFVSADGLGGRGNSILEYDPVSPYAVDANSGYGLGNAQTPHGIDPTGLAVFGLYSDIRFGSAFSILTIKALDENRDPAPGLPPGPPDRLDFACMTSILPAKDELGNDIPRNESRLAEVRYIVTTETFVDAVDNDFDGNVDENDHNPPNDATDGLRRLGDLIPMTREDLHPVTGKINALSLFQLRRGLDISPDKNPFSSNDLTTQGELPIPPNAGLTSGRYPSRDFGDWSNGESIGAYIYDLQFEFYGRIAIALDSNGEPEIWGTGWGYQDVRGEDIGTDDELTNAADRGANAIQLGIVTVTNGITTVTGSSVGWPTTDDKLIGGTFFIMPSPSPSGGFDTTDPNNDVYSIVDSTSTTIILNREYEGTGATTTNYRIIEPTQANGVLDSGEDLGADGLVNDPLDDGRGIPNNVSNNNGDPLGAETSIGEGNGRLDSRVMGIWDSRSPDPRNPRRASELDGQDNSGSHTVPFDDDQDGVDDDVDTDATGSPEVDNPATPSIDETNDLVDDDGDGIADDRFYEPAGKPEGIDEPAEANPDDDTLPKAVRIAIAVSDAQQTLDPVVLSTTVWLSTAR